MSPAGWEDDQPRVVLVTGAARGLGACIASRFYDRGYRVAVTDLDGEAAVKAAATLDPTGSSAVGLGLDARDKAAFVRVLDDLVARWGAVHVLVNNAGLSKVEALMDITPESFGSVVSANLDGTFLGCQVLGAYFADRGYGRIVNIASLAGQNGGTATGAHYASAKGGVITLTKVFARELGPQGVTVNAISPARRNCRPSARASTRTGSRRSRPRFRYAASGAPSSSPTWPCCWRRTTRTR